MENIADVLENNQLLVFSIVLLLLCAVAARVSSWLSNRRIMMSEKTRREHEAVIQIAAFRQKWIGDPRDNLSKFRSIGVHPDTNAVNEKEFFGLVTVSQRILKREWDRLKEELRDPINFIGNRTKI